MSEPAWLCVCEAEVATRLSPEDFSGAIESVRVAPIDDYYIYVEHLLTLGSEQALAESPTLGRLLLLGLVSGVESYFRSVMASALRACPLCRNAAADQLLPYGALTYYGEGHVELGLFDAASLAGATEIRKRTQALLGISLERGSSADAALETFDKICHLRHAAVHARGTLGRGNALALALSPDANRRALTVSFTALQQAGLVCHSTVRAYNKVVYRKILERWLGEGVLLGEWDSDRPTFKPLYELFRSRKDASGPSTAYQAYRSLLKSAFAGRRAATF